VITELAINQTSDQASFAAAFTLAKSAVPLKFNAMEP